MFFSFSDREMPFAGEEKGVKNIFELFLHMLKFEIFWMRISQVIRLWKDINFSETPCTSQMISNFSNPPPPVCVSMYVCIYIYN